MRAARAPRTACSPPHDFAVDGLTSSENDPPREHVHHAPASSAADANALCGAGAARALAPPTQHLRAHLRQLAAEGDEQPASVLRARIVHAELLRQQLEDGERQDEEQLNHGGDDDDGNGGRAHGKDRSGDEDWRHDPARGTRRGDARVRASPAFSADTPPVTIRYGRFSDDDGDDAYEGARALQPQRVPRRAASAVSCS